MSIPKYPPDQSCELVVNGLNVFDVSGRLIITFGAGNEQHRYPGGAECCDVDGRHHIDECDTCAEVIEIALMRPEDPKSARLCVDQMWKYTLPEDRCSISAELANLRCKWTLSLRLPFSKEYKSICGPRERWLGHVASMLTRTRELERWFTKASEMDHERRTQLGTLGFLPPEIRDQIWWATIGATMLLEEKTNTKGAVILNYCPEDPRCCGKCNLGTRRVNNHMIPNLRQALSFSVFEFDRYVSPGYVAFVWGLLIQTIGLSLCYWQINQLL